MCRRRWRTQEKRFLQRFLEAVAPLLTREPIAQVREGDEPPSPAVQADAAATTAERHRGYHDPREQPLLLYRSVTPFTCVYRPRSSSLISPTEQSLCTRDSVQPRVPLARRILARILSPPLQIWLTFYVWHERFLHYLWTEIIFCIWFNNFESFWV